MTLNPASETSPSPDPPPDPPKSRGPRPPLFTPPAETEQPAAAASSPDPQPADGPSETGSPQRGAPDPKESPRRGGVSSARLSTADKRQLKEAIKAGVRLAGVQAHQVLVRDELEADAQLWLTTEQDEEGLGEPLSSIAARHAGPGALNPDLGDAIAALIALVTYLSRNLNIRARIRAMRAGRVDHTPPQEQAPAA